MFLPRDAMHPRYWPWPCARLCLFVCLSVTSRCSTKTAERRITQTTPRDTPKYAKYLREIHPGSPSTRAPNVGVVGQNRRLSTYMGRCPEKNDFCLRESAHIWGSYENGYFGVLWPILSRILQVRFWIFFVNRKNLYSLCLQKNKDNKLLPMTSPSINQFSKFFQCYTQ